MVALADEIEQHAQIEEQDDGGVLPKGLQRSRGEKAALLGRMRPHAHQQQRDLHQIHDTVHVQHHTAADAHAATPDQPGPGAKMLKGLHQRLVLPALDEPVVGDAVYPQPQAVFPAENLHPLQEPQHMGGNAVHIQRQAEHHGVRVPQLLQNAVMIRRGAQLFAYLLSAHKHPLQAQEICGSGKALLGAAIDQYRFHSNPSSSSRSLMKSTWERAKPSFRALRWAR